jgi:glycosyltransferase involved in cell wall biosynthesis
MSVPEISIAVPSVNGLDNILGCLEALEAQRDQCDLEILVVDRLGDSVREEIHRRFEEVRILCADSTATIPQMRSLAFQKARSRAVAVIEDHVLVPPGWARQMLEALASGAEVVGGSIENGATEGLVDWAAFLCEYSHAMPPLDAGPATWLVGNNVVYRRRLLEEQRLVIESDRWEDALHESLRASGTQLICRPEIVVHHRMHYGLLEYITQRFYYSRSFAGARLAGESWRRRLIYGCGAILLPPLLFWRIVRSVVSKKRHRLILLQSLPLLALFVVSWAIGEVVGYWFGAGSSLAKVR